MKPIALITTASAKGADTDLPFIQTALNKAGIEHQLLNWDQTEIDWATFDWAVLRSPWDYTHRYAEFRNWLTKVSSTTRLLNPVDIVRWNSDKRYLNDLESAGVAVVATLFLEPGEDVELPDFEQIVVKPAISAGSKDTARYAQSRFDIAREHAEALLAQGRTVMIQPYMDRIDDAGESALMFLNHQFSHCVRKNALLNVDGTSTNTSINPEHVTVRAPCDDEMTLALSVLKAIPFTEKTFYARVDLIRDNDNQPILLELELTEPSLFFRFAPEQADVYAEQLKKRMLED